LKGLIRHARTPPPRHGTTAAQALYPIGAWVGKPNWRHGFATEAAVAVLRYGFKVLGLHRIYARHFKRNPASGRVLQKLGMTYEGCRRQHVMKWGVFEDMELYGILRTDDETR
jgi:[ribosomal protein S5]-alanine N-acetyltransferase